MGARAVPTCRILLSARRAVPDGQVTADAGVALVAGRALADDVVDDALVTADAVGLEDARVAGLDADRLVEVLQGEALGVPEPVLRLGEPLAQDVVRDV